MVDRKAVLEAISEFFAENFPKVPRDNIEGMKASGLFVGGSLAEARDEWRRIYDAAPCEYVTLIWHWAQVPKDVLLEELARDHDAQQRLGVLAARHGALHIPQGADLEGDVGQELAE